MSGLVDSNRIKVEGFQRQTGEVDQPVHNRRLPFSETILDGSEFGQLTIPIRVNTEGLHITILIEVRSLTTICLDGVDGAVIFPKCREDTRCVVLVADLFKGLVDGAGIKNLSVLTLKSRYCWKFHG